MNIIINRFKKSIKNNRLSHLYLLTGAPVAILNKLAMDLSYLIIKEGNPEPNLEIQIKNSNYPNLIFINKEGQSIKKEQVLSLQEEFSKTSLIPGARIYIISEANTMSQAAANSLLKFLEEPEGMQTIGFLLSDNIDLILPTIISRSQVILIDYKRQEFIDLLIKENITEKDAYFLSEFTNDLDLVYTLVDDPLYIESIKYFEIIISWLLNNKESLYLITNEIGQKYYNEKEYIILILKLLANVLMDVIHTHMHQEINYDFYKESILELVRVIDLSSAEQLVKLFYETIKNLNTAANPLMQLQKLSININEVLKSWKKEIY